MSERDEIMKKYTVNELDKVTKKSNGVDEVKFYPAPDALPVLTLWVENGKARIVSSRTLGEDWSAEIEAASRAVDFCKNNGLTTEG